MEDCNVFFLLEKYFLSIISKTRNAQVILAEKLQMKIKSFQKQKHGYLIYFLSDKAFKSTVVNLQSHYLSGGSLKIKANHLHSDPTRHF